jgi:hypothetical protein
LLRLATVTFSLPKTIAPPSAPLVLTAPAKTPPLAPKLIWPLLLAKTADDVLLIAPIGVARIPIVPDVIAENTTFALSVTVAAVVRPLAFAIAPNTDVFEMPASER